MNTLVLLRMVPDLVEELEVDASGKALDRQWLRFVLNEVDDHALEEALLLKERHGGSVTVLALDAPEVDDTLYTAAAKGADRVVKITHSFDGVGTWTLAQLLAQVVSAFSYDLLLTGVQAVDDLDGVLAPMLAARLRLPYLGPVTAVRADPAAKMATIERELAGGVKGEYRLPLPCVLGIQAAEKPPRYVAVSRVRQAMKTTHIEEIPAPEIAAESPVAVRRLYKLEVAGGAEMLEGTPQEVARKLVAILAERGML